MEKRGTLTITDAASVDGVQLAIKLADDPLGTAAALITQLGFSEGDRVWIKGSLELLDGLQVLFMKSVSRLVMMAADPLAGDPDVEELEIECKNCGFVNILEYVDVVNPGNCLNPNPPLHKLKLT